MWLVAADDVGGVTTTRRIGDDQPGMLSLSESRLDLLLRMRLALRQQTVPVP